MTDLSSPQLHDHIFCLLSTGLDIAGVIQDCSSAWIHLETDQGLVHIRWEHVIAWSETPLMSSGGGKTAAAKKRSSSHSPGRAWQEGDLRLLADAFLDGVTDQELAKEFNRTRAAIKQMRQGFECARGNLNQDLLEEIAQSWVHRWRKLLTVSD